MTFSLPSKPLVGTSLPSTQLPNERGSETTHLPALQSRSSNSSSNNKLSKSAAASVSTAHIERALSKDTHSNQQQQQQSTQLHQRQKQPRRHSRRQIGPRITEAKLHFTAARASHHATKASTSTTSETTSTATNATPPSQHALTVMDERILMLYHASLKQSWTSETPSTAALLRHEHACEHARLLRAYGHEATFAATQLQRIHRGIAARVWFAAFDGPRRQRAARIVQFAFRRLVIRQRMAQRGQDKRVANAVRIQSWLRGCCCRERLLDAHARTIVRGVVLLQRRVRGHRFWRIVASMLHARRCRAATIAQRCVRGWRGRRFVAAVRFEQQRFVRNLTAITAVHRSRARCSRCDLEQCTEDSLFDCFMARYVGLHDLHGARTLCLDGLERYPTSGRFCFFYAVLTLVMGDDVDTPMTFLARAQRMLHMTDDALKSCEQQYLLPALQLRPMDVAAHLDLAVFCQCSEHIVRAESLYAKALALAPVDYDVPGYFYRVQMLDRLLLNYHRFCSLFNSRRVNVLAKVLAVAKRSSEHVRIMVAKINQFTVIFPADATHATRVNTLYLTDDDVQTFLREYGSSNSAAATGNDGGDKPVTTASDPVASEAATLTLPDTAVGSSCDIQSEDASRGRKLLPVTSSSSNRGINTSMRQRTMKNLMNDATVAARTTPPTSAKGGKRASMMLPLPPPVQLVGRRLAFVQHFQCEFRGLNVHPTKLAAVSEKRSKLALTREHAELLLKHLVFVTTTATDTAGADMSATSRTVPPTPSTYILLLPSVLKAQQQRRAAAVRSHAAIDVQRVFAGFQLRAQARREQLIQRIQQRQVHDMLARLQTNFVTRDRRRVSAVAIQRIFQGFAHRRRVQKWHVAATQIQRVFRGLRGRQRALAFRDGNCTFYMAERVFQRGVEISGRRVLLVIEKCGLSFRFDGYDLEHCVALSGFVSHASALALLCYLNWCYAESFVGRVCSSQSQQLEVVRIESIERETGACLMVCRVLQPTGGDDDDDTDSRSRDSRSAASMQEVAVPLADCIQSINLRALRTLGSDAPTAAEAPLTIDDTARLVDAMVTRLVLVHALSMATKELQCTTAAGSVITLQPPPKMHMLFQSGSRGSNDSNDIAARLRTSESTSTTANRRFLHDRAQLQFPVVTDGLRGVSLGRHVFRKQCARHAAHFTRCRCVLPLTTTAAHIAVLTLALTPIPAVTSQQPRSTQADQLHSNDNDNATDNDNERIDATLY